MTPSARTARLGALAVAGATLLLLVLTEPSLAIVWDEGYTLGRLGRVRAWMEALRDPSAFAADWRPDRLPLVEDRLPPPRPAEMDTTSELLSYHVLRWFWPFAREEPHGHPPFYAIVALLGDALAPGWDELPRARLGTMLAFGLAGGGLFAFAARRWGIVPAIAAAGAWALQPRLFAHAHYATYDALLASLWLGATLAFAAAVEDAGEARPHPRWGAILLFGLLAGWAANTKLTGWFLPLPLLLWTALYRSRRGLVTLAVGALVAILTLYLFNPPWWNAPITGVRDFLASNLGRARTIPIQTLFLGRIYETPNGSLPWYNTLVWTIVIVPVGILMLALIGAWQSLRHRRDQPIGILLLCSWLTLLVLRAMPHTPGHDAERQILVAFGMLAPLAGLGALGLMERRPRVGHWLVGAAIVEGIASIALMMPVPLSYYSPLVGGLPGATRLGMEPTYYWDALDADARAWLGARTGPGRTVMFATNPTSWLYLRRWGQLRAAVAPFEPGRPRWYVVQNRPGAFHPWDRLLIDRIGPDHVIASKLGVPLVWAFPYEDFEQASRDSQSTGH